MLALGSLRIVLQNRLNVPQYFGKCLTVTLIVAVALVNTMTLYWQDAAKLLIGTPQITSITVMMDIFNSAAPYLNQGRSGEPFQQHCTQSIATDLNRYCANCGTRTTSIQKFCAKCGAELRA
jgi:hypothetical protein